MNIYNTVSIIVNIQSLQVSNFMLSWLLFSKQETHLVRGCHCFR